MRSLLDAANRDALLDRFRRLRPDSPARWGRMDFFGAMTRRSWGFFCHRHFDYHLRQLGA